jgi:predicted 2-oxoglutarate/Fe(II)-dependent dioxygenase YbiX
MLFMKRKPTQTDHAPDTMSAVRGLPALSDYRLIREYEPGLDFVYHEEFLTSDECDHLVATYERCEGMTVKMPTGDGFFDNRFLWITSLPSSEHPAKRIMQSTREQAIEIIASFYKEPGPLYSDTVQLVKWHEGQSLPAHIDNSHPDGSPNSTPWRKYASIVYLNDNYEGGELYIRPLRLRIPPKKGLLVAFRANASHEHGVTKVFRGARYTMPAWYTNDVKHRDPYELATSDDERSRR